MRKKGQLLVLCGIDGSGKTALIEKIEETFGGRFLYTREPGGTPDAEKIRELLFSETSKNLSPQEQMQLFFDARYLHLQHKIIPATAARKTVITEGFDACTYAYQNPVGNGVEELFWKLRQDVVLTANVEIVYVYLEISAKDAMKRKKATSSNDHFDEEAFFKESEKRILRYFEFFEKADVQRIILNGSQDPEKVFEDFCKDLSIWEWENEAINEAFVEIQMPLFFYIYFC